MRGSKARHKVIVFEIGPGGSQGGRQGSAPRCETEAIRPAEQSITPCIKHSLAFTGRRGQGRVSCTPDPPSGDLLLR